MAGKETEVMNKDPFVSNPLSGWYSSLVGFAARKREDGYLVQPMCSNLGG